MYRGKSSRIFPIIIIILVVAIAIAALVSVGRALFGGSSSTEQTVDESQSALIDTSGAAHVRMSVRGPITAQENFRSYQVDISPTSRNLTTFSGYQGQRLDGQQLGNNTTAYEEFVYALNRLNVMKPDALKGEDNDTRGVCANGRLYEFVVMRGDRVVKQLWTSSCGNARGSFRANLDQTRALFLRQLPDSERLTNRVDL
jgi:hypothetical protein